MRDIWKYVEMVMPMIEKDTGEVLLIFHYEASTMKQSEMAYYVTSTGHGSICEEYIKTKTRKPRNSELEKVMNILYSYKEYQKLYGNIMDLNIETRTVNQALSASWIARRDQINFYLSETKEKQEDIENAS